jgi:hypothetical protein
MSHCDELKYAEQFEGSFPVPLITSLVEGDENFVCQASLAVDFWATILIPGHRVL